MEHEHFQPQAVAGPSVFQHLLVTGGVAKRGDRAAADHEVNALSLAGVVVVEEELRFFCEDRLAILVIAVLCRQRCRPLAPGGCRRRVGNTPARNPGARR